MEVVSLCCKVIGERNLTQEQQNKEWNMRGLQMLREVIEAAIPDGSTM